jgi:threonine aldolase
MTSSSAHRGFGSDNGSGAHPKIVAALTEANSDHVSAYGNDLYTEKAREAFRRLFDRPVDTYFVLNGTAANVLSIQPFIESYHSIVCSDVAHMHMDECGAPERILGSKILTVPSVRAKITPESIRREFFGFGFEHHSQVKVVSITQPTELGTLYTVDEIRAIADTIHEVGGILHMDGARISNAVAALNVPVDDMTFGAGVDVVSFGGAKNGVLFGEAVVFRDDRHRKRFPFLRKQSMQLLSKMRFISSQFSALLEDDLWLKNAAKANAMAKKLEERIRSLDSPIIGLAHPAETNGVFVKIRRESIEPLQSRTPFYVWEETPDEATDVCRLMCSWDTTDEDIDRMIKAIESESK